MSSELEFDEKKFWITLFSAVIRREERDWEMSREFDQDIREGHEAILTNR